MPQPKKRDWVPGTFQVHVWMRTTTGGTIDLENSKCDRNSALVKVACLAVAVEGGPPKPKMKRLEQIRILDYCKSSHGMNEELIRLLENLTDEEYAALLDRTDLTKPAPAETDKPKPKKQAHAAT